MRDNFLLSRTLGFAVDIVKFCRVLQREREFVLSHQLLKSGTSIGANVREADAAISRAEFIAKLQISFKEAAETEYWLLLLEQTDTHPETAHTLFEECTAIKKILSKSLQTAKQNSNPPIET